MIDIPSGFTGFTIDVFGGSASDIEGDVSKVLFAITYQLRVNDVNFTITNGPDHWSALMPSGEYIGLQNPKVIFSNRDSAIVQFDMDSKYPSNTLAILSYRNTDAKFTVTEISREPGDPDNPFIPNTIIGSMGFSSNEYGGGTNDEGEVARIVFNISFANHKNEVEFAITEDPEDWAVLMGDGSYINLINPHVLFQNRDGATIVFHMVTEYPSNSPGFLVKRRKEADYTTTEIDEDHPFVPIQNIVFPTYIPAGERINLHSQVVVYPMNSTLRGIEWTLANEGATGGTIQNGWITTARPGKITLKATVPNGSGLGSNYSQNIDVLVIDNWIVIEQQPHLDMAAITGNIKEEISVIATTPSGELTYQWYKNTTASNESGTAISGATSPIYPLSKGLIPGDYYYFCEVRKVNFPSVRTNTVKVRVRDTLIKLDIFPPAASIPPGSTQQFAVTRNPQTSDETAKVVWHSDNHSVITIDQNGLATAFNPGKANISASMDNVTATIVANTVFTPVTSINFNMDTVIETGSSYELPKTVNPVNASKQSIVWTIISAGTTGAMINGNKLVPNGIGNLVLRATIVNGATPTTNFVQEFSITVIKGIVPVVDITLDPIGSPRVGEIVALRGSCTPAGASNTNIVWSIEDAGTSRAKLTSGNLLTTENDGSVTVLATVINGKGKNSNFTKTFPINFLSRFVSVDAIQGFPEKLEYYEGKEGVPLTANVTPENAVNKDIIYAISNTDTSGISPKIVDGVLTYDPTSMTFESEISIIVSMVVKNGLSNNVDFITESAIFISPPAAPETFVPIVEATWRLPSILRAYRPILIDRSDLTPYDATKKQMEWKIFRDKDIGGCASLIFLHTDENHADLVANGVLFNDDFVWTERGNYIYPMSKGELRILLEVFDGIEVNQDFTDEKVVNVLDPFIAVKDIKNVPTQIYDGTQFYLSPEIDTGDGMNEQTAEWDDREATFNRMEYSITSGTNLATINSNGVITPKSTGNITVQIKVQNGTQEYYKWYDKTFEKIDFVKTFQIKIVPEETSRNKIVRIKKSGGIFGSENIDIYTKAEFDLLRSIGAPESTIPLKGKMVARNTITEISFYDNFAFTDLSNFGRNFTSLKKINRIPECATNLRNFLRGCTTFNQAITIPSDITGDRCLEGFLRDCTSFNQPIVIPKNISGEKCLESFLRGCKAFNRRITLPTELTGDCCMYSFLHDCISFNSTIVLPKKISGKRCMENVLRNCQSFNKNITLPEEISGHYNIAAFMYTCNSMDSLVVVPTTEFVTGSMEDVITFSTFYRNSKISNGVKLVGPGAAALKEKIYDLGSDTIVPLRKMLVDSSEVPDPEPNPNPFVGVSVLKEVGHNGVYDDFVIGDDVNYTITVTNRSEIDVTKVSVVDSMPAEILYTLAECDHPEFTMDLIRDATPEVPEEPANPFEEWDVSTDGEPVKVTVSPVSANVLPGGTVQFYAFGDDTQKVIPTADVEWTIDSTKSTIVDGLLTVGADETDVATLTITATMTSLNGNIEPGTASVGIIHTWTPDSDVVTAITITPEVATVQTTKTHQFYVNVNGNECLILPNDSIIWSIDSTKSTIVDGLLTVGSKETKETIIVTATTSDDETITATATVTISKLPLGRVKAVVLNLAKMVIGEEVAIKVAAKAEVLGNAITNTATLTFDQMDKQETTDGNESSAIINIIERQPVIDPENPPAV